MSWLDKMLGGGKNKAASKESSPMAESIPTPSPTGPGVGGGVDAQKAALSPDGAGYDSQREARRPDGEARRESQEPDHRVWLNSNTVDCNKSTGARLQTATVRHMPYHYDKVPEKRGPSQRYRQQKVLEIEANRFGAGKDRIEMMAEYAYDGWSVMRLQVRPSNVEGFLGGAFGAECDLKFEVSDETLPSKMHYARTRVGFYGSLDPPGPGYCEFKGGFLVEGDGTLSLEHVAVTKGKANAFERGGLFYVGWDEDKSKEKSVAADAPE